MPRVAGQIDVAKNEAILDAAVEVLSERGVSAPMEEIARRACVSKQTIYNHYGSKAELARALAERRVHEITAPLLSPDAMEHPAEALASFGQGLLEVLLKPRGASLMRMAIMGSATMPEVGEAMYEAGPKASRLKLAEFLRLEHAAGRLDIPDPLQAAEFFAGMVVGSHQTAALLGTPIPITDAGIEALAKEAAARFLRAYAV